MEPSALVYDTAAAAEVWRRVEPTARGCAPPGRAVPCRGGKRTRRRHWVSSSPTAHSCTPTAAGARHSRRGARGTVCSVWRRSSSGRCAPCWRRTFCTRDGGGRTGDAAPVPAAGVHRRGGVPAGLRRAVPAAGGRLSAPAADGGGAAVGDPGKKAGGFAGEHLDNGE